MIQLLQIIVIKPDSRVKSAKKLSSELHGLTQVYLKKLKKIFKVLIFYMKKLKKIIHVNIGYIYYK